MGDAELEHTRPALSKTAISTKGGAQSGARDDQSIADYGELARVVQAWPELPEHIRAAIKALIRSCKEGE